MEKLGTKEGGILNRDVFISYHTDSAAHIVKKICAALEGAGINCWYAPRNCGPDYACSIVEAIRHCRVFLLILNEQSNLSAHVHNEINCAFDRFKNHEDIVLLPFRIDHCELSDDVYYYLGRIHIMDGALPTEAQRIRELTDRITMLLGKEPVYAGISDAGTLAKRLSGAAFGATERTYSLTGTIVYPDNHLDGKGNLLRLRRILQV